MWVSTQRGKPVASSWRVLMAAPLTLCPPGASSGRGLLLEGIFPRPVSPLLGLSPGAGQRDSRDPSTPFPRTGAELCSGSPPRRGGRWAQRLGSPVSHPSDSPSRAYLSWRCTQKHTTKITPLGIAPKGPGQSGPRGSQEETNAPGCRDAPGSEPPAAGGRRGGGSAAPGAALGDRAREGGPGRPAPSPPPPRAAAPTRTRPPLRRRPPRRREVGTRGWPLRQVAPGAGNGSSSAARTGRPAQQPLPLRSAGLQVPGRRPGRSWRRRAPLPELRSPAQTSRRAAAAVSASAPRWGCREVATVHLGQETKNPESLRVDSPRPRVPATGGNPDPDGLN